MDPWLKAFFLLFLENLAFSSTQEIILLMFVNIYIFNDNI